LLISRCYQPANLQFIRSQYALKCFPHQVFIKNGGKFAISVGVIDLLPQLCSAMEDITGY